jgi:phospholipase C
MAYPVRASEVVPGGGSVSVPFRPAAAGLVNVILVAVGLQQAPPGNGGSNGGSSGAHTHFDAFTVAVRVEIFKPGAATPVATGFQHVDVISPDIRNRIVFPVAAPAEDGDLAADWRVEISNGPAGFHPAHPLVPARCDLTVRYQVQPGNLGKIDHIAVLMMENRSFDHMLGYLSLEQGRTDVDGLTGTEYNYGPDGNRVPIHHRTAPEPGLTDTAFLTDPGHGLADVSQQLESDSEVATDLQANGVQLNGAPDNPSNGGFVLNFAKQIATDEKNANAAQGLPPLMNTVHDQAQIDATSGHTVTFRPAQPGPITVEAVATNPPKKSESGKLGRVDLRMPGSTTILATGSAPIGQTALGLHYQATAAQLATPGNWSCTVYNGTDTTVGFNTSITYVQELQDTSHFEKPEGVMSYYNAAQLPAYDFFANHFAICDRWFSSLPTDTWPNRLFAMTGGSGGLLETPSDASVEQQPPGYLLQTIFEVLQANEIDWNIFFSDLPFALIFTRLAQDATYTARMRSIDELLRRAETGDLPSFCWIDPNFQDVPDDPNAASDDHPPGDVCRGQNLISRIYTALAASPAWAKTLFIITYDEHGGFFDHVLPPPLATPAIPAPPPPQPQITPHPIAGHTAVTEHHPGTAAAGTAAATLIHQVGPPISIGPAKEGNGGDPTTYGLRVPTLLVSPWVEPKSVSKQQYEHTSLLSTTLHRFCRQPDGTVPSMGARTDNATTLDTALSATTPTIPAPTGPAPRDCQAVPVPVVDENTFGNVLRKSLFRF